jgi:CheY-like chemotaxis protein/HD-like signal output (HDOD) protein
MLQKLTRENGAVEKLTAIPLSPMALHLREVAPTRSNAPVLASLIESDSEFAKGVTELARLSRGSDDPIRSVPEAICSVGPQIIKALSLGLSAFAFPGSLRSRKRLCSTSEPSLTLEHIFNHSVACAMVAGRLAGNAGDGQRQLCFAAGFLHEIGRVLLFGHWRKDLLAALVIARIKKIPATEAEGLVLGCNHLEVGELWCRAVNLDASLAFVITSHHPEVSQFRTTDKRRRDLLNAVQLADAICESHDLGSGDGPLLPRRFIWDEIPLNNDEEEVEIAVVKQDLKRIEKVFAFTVLRRESLSQRRVDSATIQWVTSSGPAKGSSGKGRIIPFPGRRTAAPVGNPKSRDKKLTILVVEDHGSLCEMLSLYFMRHGYHVRTAMDGQSALDILSNEEIHLMLLDLMLPRLDGFAVLQHIRQNPEQKGPYVIVVSAGASAKDRNRVLELGADEYMPKPFHLIRLLERIHNVERYLLA